MAYILFRFSLRIIIACFFAVNLALLKPPYGLPMQFVSAAGSNLALEACARFERERKTKLDIDVHNYDAKRGVD